jgi:uncharacterized surface protein with fasciclin (FAS1) repeats
VTKPAAIVDIASVIAADGRLTKLLRALVAADLLAALKEKGPFTVLAPNDEAFEKLPSGTFDRLMNNIPSLKGVLLHHILPGLITAEKMGESSELETELGDTLHTSRAAGAANVEGATIIAANYVALNGLIHVIDRPILPTGVQF